jgi:uncharacterized protein (TIGR02246 family)
MSKTDTSWGDASELLAAAGLPEDQSYYREFTGDDERAVLTVAMRIQAAWKVNDADAFADVFRSDGSLLMQDTQLTSREDIRAFMQAGFDGPYKGARVNGWPLEIQFLSDDVAVVVTEGGIILPGETESAPARKIRATWVVVRDADNTLSLLSHQSSPLGG